MCGRVPKWRRCLDTVERMYNEGVEVARIVEVCGSYATVYRALHFLESEGRVKMRRRRFRRARLSDWEVERIRELWENGMTIYSIAKIVGRAPSTVYNVIQRFRGNGEE